MAEPNRQQRGRKRTHRSPPISRHPLFPAIVALWFAALVGFGSFALSTSLIERAILAAGIDGVIPAAAPPLGITARLLLGLSLGAAGGAIGWAVARRLAQAQNAPAPQVFSVYDSDLEQERLPWPSMEQQSPAEPAAPILDPASLSAGAADEAPPGRIAPEPEPEPTAAQRIASASLSDLSHVELVERLAIALQHRQERLGAALDEAAGDTPETESPVVHFPDFADRQNARLAPPLPAPAPRPAPHETEKALREALATLQRMSSRA